MSYAKDASGPPADSPLRVPGGVLESLEVTLAGLDLIHSSAAHVAAMRAVARRMDLVVDADLLTKLANTAQRQLDFLLKNFVAAGVEVDPWEELSRTLSAESSE